jgi:hypothetical protein
MDESFEQTCAFCTVRITIPEKGLSKGLTGTGFLYRAAFGDEGKSLTILISNRHVFVSPKRTVKFQMNFKAEGGSPAYGNQQGFS